MHQLLQISTNEKYYLLLQLILDDSIICSSHLIQKSLEVKFHIKVKKSTLSLGIQLISNLAATTWKLRNGCSKFRKIKNKTKLSLGIIETREAYNKTRIKNITSEIITSSSKDFSFSCSSSSA